MQATLGENIKIINLSLRRRQKWQKGLCLVLKRHDFSATQGKYPGPLIKLQLHCSFCMKVKALVKHVFRCTSQLCSFCCSQIKPRSGLSIFFTSITGVKPPPVFIHWACARLHQRRKAHILLMWVLNCQCLSGISLDKPGLSVT